MKIYIYEHRDTTCLQWWMLYQYNYYRRIKVTQENRRYVKDYEEKNEYGFKLRGRRNKAHLNAWTLERVSTRIETKSWKSLTKGKKQYEKNYLLRKVVVVKKESNRWIL